MNNINEIPEWYKCKIRDDGLHINYEFMLPEHEISNPNDPNNIAPLCEGMPPITRYPVVDLILRHCRIDDYLEVERPQEGEKRARKTGVSINVMSTYRHFKKNKSIAIYPIEEGNDKTNIIVFDFDDHESQLAFKEITACVRKVQTILKKDGLHPFPVRSGGGSGAHILLIFEKPISAHIVRRYAKGVLKKVGLRDGDAGVYNKEVEVFPKQDSVPVGGYGNPIALPYAGESVPLDAETLEPLDLVAAKELKIKLSPEPPEVNNHTMNHHLLSETSSTNDGLATADFELVKKRCPFIEHCCTDADSLSEPEWYSFLTVGSRCIDGEKICHNASEPYSGYTEEETSKKIQHALKSSGPMTCEKIKDLTNNQYCESCEQQGKVKSPIRLGYENIIPAYIEELNDKHAAVNIKGKFQIINEETAPNGNREISFSTEKDFKSRYANRLIANPNPGPGRPARSSIAQAWMQSPHRREYDSVIFSPGQETPNHYNLFQGFAITPRSGHWTLMRNHILSVICKGNKQIFQWVLAWMARIVQDPGGARPGTAIVLRGKQGTGKGVFVDNFGQILGSHYVQVTQQGQLVGKFNVHLAQSILVFCDEGYWAGGKQAEGTLKAIITEPKIMCEPKGVNAFKIDNHINLIMASNNHRVVPAGAMERRFLVLDISDAYQQDHTYFGALEQQMNAGGREAMLNDLLKLDISDVNLRKAPQTNALLDQILCSMSSVEKFWFNLLVDGNDNIFGCLVETIKLMTSYEDFCMQIKERYPEPKSEMVKVLRNLCPKMVPKQPKADDGSRRRGYQLPTLEDCRDAFSAKVGIQIDWSEF